jgi:hypothetical protein
MDFRKATDELMASTNCDHLAKALGVSVSLVRQAKVREGALCHRNPPKGWEPVVLRLAKQNAEHFRRLAERLSTKTETLAGGGPHRASRRRVHSPAPVPTTLIQLLP